MDTLAKRIAGLSLRKKILAPFFVILGLLGAATIFGAAILISQTFHRTADERLQAIQEVAFREIKKQETLLATYAQFLAYTQAVDWQAQLSGETLILQNGLYEVLQQEDISVAFFSLDILSHLPYPSLRTMLLQAQASGKPRFRFTAEEGNPPTLAVAAPARYDGRIQNIMLLQMPLDRSILRQLAHSFNAEISLLSSHGVPLVSSSNDLLPILSNPEIATLMNGGQVVKTTYRPLPHRLLYRAVPLGNTDLVFMATELPMGNMKSVIENMTANTVLIIFCAMLIGAYIYSRLVRGIIHPLNQLLFATEAIGAGDLDRRLPALAERKDEFGRLAQSFNEMLERLGAAYAQKAEQEKDLALAHEELRYQDMLEKKNEEIQRANHELKVHLENLSTLFKINQAMIATLDQNILGDRILQLLQEALECEEAVLLLHQTGSEDLEIRAYLGSTPNRCPTFVFRLDDGPTGLAARTQQVQYLADLASDPRCRQNRRERLPTEGSMICAPLVVNERLRGILNLYKKKVNGFTEADIKMVQAAANQAAIALENILLYEKTRDLSNTDALTGLANRRYFQEIVQRELAQARRYDFNFSLVMADIDHFKLFNDTHGHLRGDVVLRRVATIMLQNTRGIDLVARFGGEEFIILLPRTDKEGAFAAAEKLRQVIAGEHFAGAEQSQPGGALTLSLGIAEYPLDSVDIEELINLADQALYQAKKTGRNRTVIWGGSLPEQKPTTVSA
jgi:diguanylate cyclase (GGDEF)-like protein